MKHIIPLALMNTHLRCSLFLFVFLLQNFYANAQQANTPYDIASRSKGFYPASVQAAELFKKNPEEMDYATGRATIRIPLYTIHTASFTLPISLAYTTGGIKTEQKNGSVALG